MANIRLQADQTLCPKCGAVVHVHANVCPYCKADVLALESRGRRRLAPLLGKLIVLVILSPFIAFIGLGLLVMAKNSVSGLAEQRTQQPEQAASPRESGFHCLSKWDGSHPALVRRVRDGMREPSSFEHVETRITPRDKSGRHTLFMTYRGRNGFGGVSVEQASAIVDGDSCALVRTGA